MTEIPLPQLPWCTTDITTCIRNQTTIVPHISSIHKICPMFEHLPFPIFPVLDNPQFSPGIFDTGLQMMQRIERLCFAHFPWFPFGQPYHTWKKIPHTLPWDTLITPFSVSYASPLKPYETHFIEEGLVRNTLSILYPLLVHCAPTSWFSWSLFRNVLGFKD